MMTVNSKKSKGEVQDLGQHLKLLRGRARKMGVPAADADDIVQEAFVKAIDRDKPLPVDKEERKAVLLTIVKFQILTYYAEKKRAVQRAARARIGATVIGLGYACDKTAILEAREQLELVFPHIPPQILDVYIEKVLDDLTLPEVAELLDLNVRTAQSYWQRAITRLEGELEKLEKPHRRRLAGCIALVFLSKILGAARDAHAMANGFVRALRHFLRFSQLPIRISTGLATSAALVMYSPGQTSASVDESIVNAQTTITAVTRSGGTASKLNEAPAPAEPRASDKPVPNTCAKVVAPRSKPAKHHNTKKKFVSVDGVLSLAKAAANQQQPKRVLQILNRISAQELKPNDAEVVRILRTGAERAIAMKL